jgi:hypothetical protein
MVSKALYWWVAVIEQDIAPGAFQIPPQGVDRQGFLVFEMIEEGAFGHTCSIGYVLNRTPVEAARMQCFHGAAGQFFA